MATSNPAGPLPASQIEMIQQLFASVHSLQDSVKQLKQENQTLREKVQELDSVKGELITLQQNCGMRFGLFGKLPVEIRRIIWRMATRVPQIHILNEEMSTRSKINAVRDSCQEARREFDMLELDYFQHSLDESQYEHSAVRCYVNLDLDTVWLSFAGAFICVPEEIPFHCGKCRGPMGTEVPGCHEYVFRGSFRQIKRLAINHLSWLEPEEFSDNGTMEILWRHKVEQLLIVVGDYIGLAKDRDVQFITPSQPLHHGMYGNGPILPGPNESWHEKEKDFVNEMEDFRTRRAAERKQMEDDGEDPDNDPDFEDL